MRFDELKVGDKFFYENGYNPNNSEEFIWMKTEVEGDANCCRLIYGINGCCFDSDEVKKVEVEITIRK